ncbi:hypothetical protein [Azospirillum sp. SYSU D00513]|uniref:hypothetical protein n=1 Tax=Azospirillum sp. SYSU D00513 TaxID=2812561 RepID=UPI001A95EC46|nr:hypothetical protein [Azospirillum sp. SYSU D00513]
MASKSSWAGKGAGPALAAGLAVLLAAAPASAQSCAELIERFAANHDLSASPPPTMPPSALEGVPEGTAGSSGPGGQPSADGGSGAVTSESLADSGGVIAPPAMADGAAAGPVIEPPAAGTSNMPTAPGIGADSGATGGGGATGDAMASAAQTAQVDSLVTAAREAAQRGDEAQCLGNLERALNLSRRMPGGAGGG